MSNLNMITPLTVQGIINKFCYTIGMLPTSYKQSLTYEEQLLAIGHYLETTVFPAINNNAQALAELQGLFAALQDYVNNYFDNLNVTEEINQKLDDMAESGELENIIAAYLQTKAIFGFDTVADMKESINLNAGSYAKTLGYHSKNDCGAALYFIREVTNNDSIDEGHLIALNDETLVAELINFNDTVTPEQFGAYGDGIHDDYIALNNAIEYFSEKGGTVKLNAKTYLVTHTIILRSLVNIIGVNQESSIIKLATNANCDVMKAYNYTDTETIIYTLESKNILEAKDYMLLSVRLENFQIDGNRMDVNTETINNTSGYGLRINPYCFNSKNVLVRNCAQVGVYIENTRVGFNWTNDPTNNDITINSYWGFEIHGCGEEGIIIRGLPDTHCEYLIVQNCNANDQKSSVFSNDSQFGSVVIDSTSWHRGSCNFGDVHIAGSPCYCLISKGTNRIKADMLMMEGSHGGWYADQSAGYHQISKIDLHNINDVTMYMLYTNLAYIKIDSLEVRNESNYSSLGLSLNGGIHEIEAIYRDLTNNLKQDENSAFTLACYDSKLNINISNLASAYAVQTTSSFASSYLNLKTYLCAKDFNNSTMGRRNQIEFSAYKSGTIVKDNILTERNLAATVWFYNTLLSLNVSSYNNFIGVYPCKKYISSSFALDSTLTTEQTLTTDSNPFFMYSTNANYLTPTHNSKSNLEYLVCNSWSDNSVTIKGKINNANGETKAIVSLNTNVIN